MGVNVKTDNIMVAQRNIFVFISIAIYAQFAIDNYFVFCSVLDKSGNLNDVKILPKKYVIDVTQNKALSNLIYIAHQIPIDGKISIAQTKPKRSRVSLALNSARRCRIKVELNEANDCSLQINLNGARETDVEVFMNKAKNSKLLLTFTNPSKVSAKVTMDSPTGSTVEIRHDHGFNSSIVAKVTNAKNSKFTIRQLKPKASPLDVCIQEEIKNNAIDVNQIQPIQSELVQKSSSCSSNDENGLTPNAVPDNQASTEVPNITTKLPSEENDINSEVSSTPVPDNLTTARPQSVTTEAGIEITTSRNETEFESTDYNGSQSAVFFEDSESADDTENLDLIVDVGEDEDYYYYYDFNNDDTLNVEDFPDYEDYLNGVGTRNKIRGKCIRVLKNETKGKDWKRKIGPLWRSLAQQIGVRRCRTNDKIQELNVVNDAIRFGA